MLNQGTANKAVTLAAKISSDTWHRLSLAHRLRARLGEETITDLLILEMLQYQRSNAFLVYHPTGQEESCYGADMLLWIVRRKGRSRFLAIQSKKLYPNGHYTALNHYRSDGARQIDLLENFARQYHAIPLYLLYNHYDSNNWDSYWHCCKVLDIEQLGCTLVPSWKIKRAINERGQRKFTAIHASANVRPWRCVFDCDQAEQQIKQFVTSHKQELPIQGRESDSAPTAELNWYPELLSIDWIEFLSMDTGPLSSVVLGSLRKQIERHTDNTRLKEGEKPIYPRKLLIVDYSSAVEEGEGQPSNRTQE